MRYELRLTTTASGVGHFACAPAEAASFDEYLAYLRHNPMDSFMHVHLLEMMGTLDAGAAAEILDAARGRDPIVTALLCEASLAFPRLAGLQERFTRAEAEELLAFTPLIYIKSGLMEGREAHQQWIRALDENISKHRAPVPPEELGLAPLFEESELPEEPGAAALRRRFGGDVAGRDSGAPLSATETARMAIEKIGALGLFTGEETRHGSSLSPYGFLRKWRVTASVRHGRCDYSFSGVQTSYGKGLTEDAARASYSMEVVERASSFASIGPEGVIGRTRPYPLTQARHSELALMGVKALDPNSLRLEAPYADEALWWMEGETPGEGSGGATEAVLVPAQCVFLFCNLDEPGLFSGLGSTGLASGTTMEQAKASALLEVIERDAEASTPFAPSRCFRLEATTPEVASLLADYEARGVHIAFQELAGALGVPCYKCFVRDRNGVVIKGTGAHLDGRKALLSALTETPYHYPDGPPSAPAPAGLRTMRFEELPDFSSGAPDGDLAILEAALAEEGLRPVYVDITRADIGIPVVKAIVPGLEIMADFDAFSRVSPKLFSRYLREARRRRG